MLYTNNTKKAVPVSKHRMTIKLSPGKTVNLSPTDISNCGSSLLFLTQEGLDEKIIPVKERIEKINIDEDIQPDAPESEEISMVEEEPAEPDADENQDQEKEEESEEVVSDPSNEKVDSEEVDSDEEVYDKDVSDEEVYDKDVSDEEVSDEDKDSDDLNEE